MSICPRKGFKSKARILYLFHFWYFLFNVIHFPWLIYLAVLFNVSKILNLFQ